MLIRRRTHLYLIEHLPKRLFPNSSGSLAVQVLFAAGYHLVGHLHQQRRDAGGVVVEPGRGEDHPHRVEQGGDVVDQLGRIEPVQRLVKRLQGVQVLHVVLALVLGIGHGVVVLFPSLGTERVQIPRARDPKPRSPSGISIWPATGSGRGSGTPPS